MAENLTLNVNMENLTSEEREILLAIVSKANKPKSKLWKPRNLEPYYGIHCDGDIHEFSNWDTKQTKAMVVIGNCFRTREEAELALERLKVIQELREFATEENTDKEYILYYSTITENVWYGKFKYHYGGLRFATQEDANAAIKAVGEERIKKYYLGVK